jgi:hypothetical protein
MAASRRVRNGRPFPSAGKCLQAAPAIGLIIRVWVGRRLDPVWSIIAKPKNRQILSGSAVRSQVVESTPYRPLPTEAIDRRRTLLPHNDGQLKYLSAH